MKRIALFTSLVVALGAAGCPAAPEKHYPLLAEVISVDAPKGCFS